MLRDIIIPIFIITCYTVYTMRTIHLLVHVCTSSGEVPVTSSSARGSFWPRLIDDYEVSSFENRFVFFPSDRNATPININPPSWLINDERDPRGRMISRASKLFFSRKQFNKRRKLLRLIATILVLNGVIRDILDPLDRQVNEDVHA